MAFGIQSPSGRGLKEEEEENNVCTQISAVCVFPRPLTPVGWTAIVSQKVKVSKTNLIFRLTFMHFLNYGVFLKCLSSFHSTLVSPRRHVNHHLHLPSHIFV